MRDVAERNRPTMPSMSLIDWLTGISSSSPWFCLGGRDGVSECYRNAFRDIPAAIVKVSSCARRDTVATQWPHSLVSSMTT